jgi:LPXTG-motif cell wall-anchored protein
VRNETDIALVPRLRCSRRKNMDTNTLLIIVVVLLLVGGGGIFYRRRI